MTEEERVLVEWGKPRLPRLQAQQVRLLVAFILLVNIIVACGGGGDETPVPGDNVDSVPGGGTSLTCGQECLNRGQCGESSDRGTVVLMSVDQPAVSAIDHDLAIPAGSPVDVREQRPVTLVENATGLEFPVTFYRVFVPNRNVEAWVAEWCVINAQPSQ